MRPACPTPDSNRNRPGRIHHTRTGTATGTGQELERVQMRGNSCTCVRVSQQCSALNSARSDNAFTCACPNQKYQPLLASNTASPSPSSPSSSSSPSHRNHTNTSLKHSRVALLTPASSRASLLTPSSRYKAQPSNHPVHNAHPTSPPPTPLRRHIPVKPSLSLTVNLNPAAFFSNMAGISRPVSPPPRPMSPSSRPDLIPRPSSRCESLLRDTLRRADEYERTQSVSRARSKSRRRTRPRGNSLLGQLRQDDEEAEDERDYDVDTRSSSSSSLAYRRGSFDFFRAPAPSAPRPFKGAFVGSPPEVDHFPYGSPSSPSPMPPTMHRTRTAPMVPQASGSNVALEAQDHMRPMVSHTAPQSPRASRQPLPKLASAARRTSSAGPQSPVHADNVETSPGSRGYVISPHEAVLRAKLESVLHRGGPPVLETRLEERGNVEQKMIGYSRYPRQRNHVRSHSQLVGNLPGQRYYGEQDPGMGLSISPNVRMPWFSFTSCFSLFAWILCLQTLASNSLSASGTDLTRLQTSTPGYRHMIYHRDSDHSPSEPSEPMTPPPTPPFNARTASEVCKRMDGYVSFASVEGLGEPPGLDMDGREATSEEGLRKWGRFLRVWPFNQHGNGSGEHQDAGGYIGRREVSATR